MCVDSNYSLKNAHHKHMLCTSIVSVLLALAIWLCCTRYRCMRACLYTCMCAYVVRWRCFKQSHGYENVWYSLWAEGNVPNFIVLSEASTLLQGNPLKFQRVLPLMFTRWNWCLQGEIGKNALVNGNKEGSCLLGWGWLKIIKLDWNQISRVQGVSRLAQWKEWL